MCFPVPYAGFFAKSQIMFFLLSSFRFCPPLKNDGTSGLHFASSIEWKLPQKKRIVNVSRPRIREASEPLFEERSDAVKVSETLCLG